MKMLIVDDDVVSRRLLAKISAQMGCEVNEAPNGVKAWELLQQQPVDLVVTDWMMPDMDGLELCRRIRAAQLPQYVYLIMLTAKNSKQDLLAALQAGADDYTCKPLDVEEFKARVMTGKRVAGLEERHRLMQQTLIESRNQLRIVFDALKEGIVSLDRDFKIVSLNKTFSQDAGSPSEALFGQDWRQLVQLQNARLVDEKIKNLADKVIAQGQPESIEFNWLDSSGQKCFKQVHCLPITNDRNEVHKIVLVYKDISEDRRKSEQIQALNKRMLQTSAQVEAKNTKLESALKRLEQTQAKMLQSEKLASIGQLAAGVAHEINNPTGFVSSNLITLGGYQEDLSRLLSVYQELKKSLLELPSGGCPVPIATQVEQIQGLETEIDIAYIQGDMADLIKDCREGTDRIKKIVEDLKHFAHPGQDKVQDTDLNKELESTLNVVHNEIKYKATVVKEFGDLPIISANPQQLNQVFMNILVNAAQAIPKMGEIRIKTEQANGHVQVRISDTGCGIPEQNLIKIFDPFFTTKEVGKGTGLGLHIAYTIIKKHGGEIQVESQVGVGTTFCITLPVNPAARDNPPAATPS